MRRLLTGFAVLVLAPGLLAAQDTRTIVPEDYYEVQRLSSPALSPDGRHLLYQVETVRRDENDRINHIWWTDLETDRTQRLSTAGVNSTNPRWTPDGRRIYFNTSRGGESGLHFLNFLEPGGEAYRIPGISGSPDFHPDGSWILVTRRVRPDGEARDADDADEADDEDEIDEAIRHLFEPADYWPSGTPALTGPADRAAAGQTEEERNLDVYVISHSSYKRDGTLTYAGPGGGGGFGGQGGQGQNGYVQFFRVPADGLAPGEEAEQLTFDEVDKNFREFSRDGNWILYTTAVPAAEPEEEDDEDTGVFRMPATGGDGELLYQTSYQIRSISLSPDNGRLAYVTVEESQTDPYIRVVSIGDGAVTELAREDWVHSIGNVTWSTDGSHLLWTSAIGGQDQLVRVAADGGPVERVTDGRHTFSGFDMNLDQGKIAYVKSTAERPWEAFVASIDGAGEQQVTAVNEEWLEGVRLSRVEHFAFEGTPHNRDWLDELPQRGAPYMLQNRAPDGERFEVDAWLVYPVDYVEGRSYPMVVSIHGGPHSRYAETWFPEFQMLAAEGMFVLYTNPRGSSGYGMEFQYSTLNAWGIDDTKDILDAVDIVVDRGLADPDRLGITGGSYGGFMTSWMTAHDQRWRAALTARGIVNWISFYGVSDASGLVEREFGGMPWPYKSTEEGSYNLAMELSPIVWADQVETPTLIVHSINDYRTPMEGADQWYRALQKHDVPVRMVLFPDSSHGLSRTGEPWLLVRRLHEYTDWFGSYLVGSESVTVDSADDDLDR